MFSLGQDVRYGARLLLQSPSFAAIAVAALALGIGATTAIFSVVDAVLLKPLPFRQPERLLVIYEKNPSANHFRLFAAPANLFAWRREARTLEGLEAVQEGLHANLSGGPNGPIEPEELRVERVSAGLFPLLGVQPVVGRSFREDEDKPGHNTYAVLSRSLWLRRFGGDPSISGKSIRLRDLNYTVLGVMPAGFSILDPQIDVWVPLGLNPGDTPASAGRNLVVVARMRPGMGIEQTRSELNALGARLENENRALNAGYRPSVYAFRDELVSFRDQKVGDTRRALLILFGAVGFLLLMTCVNVANLLLARGAARRKEIAVRTALGATRGRVMAQLLSESLLLAVAGGAAGLVLAFGGISLVRWLGPSTLPRLGEVALDARLLLFALALSLATGAIFGLAPAIQTTGGQVNTVLTENGRGGTMGRAGRLIRRGLAVAQVALAAILLIGAGLLIRSFTRLQSSNPGFDPSGVLTFRLPLSVRAYGTPERRVAFLDEVIQRIGSLPGVRDTGAVNVLPLTGFGSGATFVVEGRPTGSAEQHPTAVLRAVTPSYFRTMAIPLAAGRELANSDTRDAARVIVINQTLARRFWPQGGALDGRLRVEQLNNGYAARIVGVVGNVNPEKLEGEDWPTIYVPYAQWQIGTAMVVAVRSGGAPKTLAAAAAREIHQINPEQPVSEVRTMNDVIESALSDSRFHAVVLGIFAAIAFALAAVGIYGVISYGVTERTHELGIRMALGAQRRDMMRLVLGEGARLAGYGIVLGLGASRALTRLMSSMLFGVNATDFETFAAIVVLLGGVALAASYIPSRRAMHLDPVSALRHE